MKRNYSSVSKSNYSKDSESRASKPLGLSTPPSNYSVNSSDHSSGYSTTASPNYGNLAGGMAQQTMQPYYAGGAASGMDTSTLYNQNLMYQPQQLYQQSAELMLQQQNVWPQQQQQQHLHNANSNGLPFFNPEYPPPVNNYPPPGQSSYSGGRNTNGKGWGNNSGASNSGSAVPGSRNSQYRAWSGGNTSKLQKQQHQQKQQQHHQQQQHQQQHHTNSNNISSNTGFNNAFLSRSITAQSTVAGVIDSELKDG